MDWYLAGLAAHLLPMACVFLASFLQAITGFGLVIVAAPLLMFFYDAKLTVIIMLFVAFLGNAMQILIIRRDVLRRLVALLILGCLPGQVIGLFVFKALPADALKIFVSAAVLAALVMMKLRHTQIERCRKNALLAGGAAGFLATTVGVAGPPIIMYFTGIGLALRNLRASSVAYFFFSNICSMAVFLAGGVAIGPAIGEFIFLVPGLFLGLLLGQLACRYIPARVVHTLIFVLLTVACLYSIGSTLLK